MLKTIQLKDLFVGKIDAKNEIVEKSTKEKEMFLNSYLMPENIIYDNFITGGKYIVSGLKGTGKTALLQYIALSVEKKYSKSTTSFILFKSEFTEDDKKDFSKAINATIADKTGIPDEEDYVSIWQWFLHRHLVKIISENPPFQNDKDLERYKKCILAPKVGDEESGITRFLPKLKKGNVELEGDFDVVKGKLGLDFEWANVNSNQVKFTSIIRQAEELFKKLTPDQNRYYIFIDELELTLGKIKQYQKDVRLIRDLLIAINKLNNICREKKYPVYFITAIRSEVLTAIPSSGKEINKIVADFGTSLNWHQSGGNIINHPLLKIINKKIQASEDNLLLPITDDINELWKKYFVSQHFNMSIQEYILRQTWYRPRDIVRMLSIAKDLYPNEIKFSSQIFDAIRKEYSTQSWIEHTEELRAKFTETEISGLKRLLYGIKCPFSFNDITIQADEKKQIYSEVLALLDKYRLGDILSSLYKVGIIGNTGEKVRFSFRGDDDILLDKKMKIHDPLWNYLSIEQNNA